MKRELCGDVEPKGDIAAFGQFHLPAAKASDVGLGAGRRNIQVQKKFELLPANIERDAAVVEILAAVAKHELADAQAEKRLAPGEAGGADFRLRQIAMAGLVESHSHLRAINLQF